MSPNGMRFLNASVSQLNLKAVLMNGQSFRWCKIGDSYYGVVDGLLYYLRRFDDTLIEWRCLGRASNRASTDASLKLHEYFQLDVPLDILWDSWCDQDSFMAKLRDIEELQGIRILKQDFFETLIAFICSSNNNIPRITRMVKSLSMKYGDDIILDNPARDSPLIGQFPELMYAFPTVDQLAVVKNLTTELRNMSFGYRAESVSEAVRVLCQHRTFCGDYLRRLPYEEIQKFLLCFRGVGPKVAECIALMSLNQNQGVPVDRHVFRITEKYFLPCLKGVKLTNTVSRRIMSYHQAKFGAYAGWAQAVLFNHEMEQHLNGRSAKKDSKSRKRSRDTRNTEEEEKNVSSED